MIDLHSHLLPGIDDGPTSVRGAIEMAHAAVATGTETMVCTPHVMGRDPLTPEQIGAAFAGLRDELARADVALEIAPGAEIALDTLPRLDDAALSALSVGGNGAWLLLELPFRGWPADLGSVLSDLEVRGFRAVLAHPERAESVQRRPDRLRDAVGRGALCQVTASSLTGEHGAAAKHTAEVLLAQGWAHLLASDAHSADWRPPGLLGGLAAAAAFLGCPPGQLTWMVREGPALVLSGADARPPRLSPPRESPAAAARGARTPRRPARGAPRDPRRG